MRYYDEHQNDKISKKRLEFMNWLMDGHYILSITDNIVYEYVHNIIFIIGYRPDFGFTYGQIDRLPDLERGVWHLDERPIEEIKKDLITNSKNR